MFSKIDIHYVLNLSVSNMLACPWSRWLVLSWKLSIYLRDSESPRIPLFLSPKPILEKTCWFLLPVGLDSYRIVDLGHCCKSGLPKQIIGVFSIYLNKTQK